MSKFHISIKKSILILGGTRKVSFQVGISRVVGPEILGGTLNPPAHYGRAPDAKFQSPLSSCK